MAATVINNNVTNNATSLYKIGNSRLDDGTSLPITSNDREFVCGFGKCAIDYNATVTASNPQDLINLDFTILNIETLRTNLERITDEVQNVYKSIGDWLTKMERDFEFKVNFGEVEMNMALFNRINLVIPKIDNARKALDDWFSEFQNLTFDLTMAMNDYSTIVVRLETLYTQTTRVSGLPESVVSMAKHNVSYSKDIQRQITRIVRADVRIRNNIQIVTNKVQELSSGILRYNGSKQLNLNTLSKIFDGLGQKDSPLARVQLKLSNIINSTPLNFNLVTPEAKLIPSIENIYKEKSKANSNDDKYILKQLGAMQNYTIYTSASDENLKYIRQYIDENLRNSSNYDEMDKILTDFPLNNIPNVLFPKLAQDATNPELTYTVIDRVKKMLENLSADDEIYRPRLKEIYKTANDSLSTILKTESVNTPTRMYAPTVVNPFNQVLRPQPPPPPPGNAPPPPPGNDVPPPSSVQQLQQQQQQLQQQQLQQQQPSSSNVFQQPSISQQQQQQQQQQPMDVDDLGPSTSNNPLANAPNNSNNTNAIDASIPSEDEDL